MPIDLPQKADIWLPPKPAIIRAWKREDARRATFPFPVFMPSATAALSSLTQHASGASAGGTGTLTLPSGIQSKDLIVIWDGSTSSDHTTIAGFTQLVTVGSIINGRLYYKLADGTESGTTITGLAGGAEIKRYFILRGNVPITTVIAQSPFSSQQTNSAPSNQTVAVSSFTEVVVVVAAWVNAGFAINPAGFSPAADVTLGLNNFTVLAYKVYASSPQNTTISGADEGSQNSIVSGYLRLT